MELPGKIAGYAFLLLGYAALAGGAWLIGAHSWFWLRANVAEGTVVGWEQMQDSYRKRNMTLNVVHQAKATVVSFRTAEGQDIVFTTNWGSSFHFRSRGDTVTVLYDPTDPDKARIRGFVSLYLAPLLLLVFGGGFWIAGQLTKFIFR